MSLQSAKDQITATALAWEGVSLAPHRFGGVEFRLGRREIGHLHGEHLLDIPFPLKVRQELVASGEAEPHHWLPDSGWVSFHIRQPDDIQRATGLLRLSYEIAFQQRQRRYRPAKMAE